MKLKEKIIFSGFMVSSSFFLASTAWSAVNQSPKLLFISSFLAWNTYLAAHRIEHGDYVDSHPESQENLNLERKTWLGVFLGSGVLVASILLGLYSFFIERFLLTFIAAVLFWTGYILAHFCATNKLL